MNFKIYIVIALVLLSVSLAGCGMQTCYDFEVDQEISVVLDAKLDEFLCNVNSGNMISDNEVYEIWSTSNGCKYLIHSETRVSTKENPTDENWTVETTKHFEMSSGNTVTGLIKEKEWLCAELPGFGLNENLCVENTCKLIVKE